MNCQVVRSLAIRLSRSTIGGTDRSLGLNPLILLAPIPLKSMSDSLVSLSRLMSTLDERAKELPEGSYTTKLLKGGSVKIGGKILEEANELIEAAEESGEEGREHFVYEAADLLYHTMVMLAWRGVDLDEVAGELARREGISGLEEKASRSNSPREQ